MPMGDPMIGQCPYCGMAFGAGHVCWPPKQFAVFHKTPAPPMDEAAIRADECERVAKMLEKHSQEYVDKWMEIDPKSADSHKADGWRILCCAALVRDRRHTAPATGEPSSLSRNTLETGERNNLDPSLSRKDTPAP